jgi:hypothetical protein
LVYQLFNLVIYPIKGKDQTQQASDDEDVILLLAFLQDSSDNLTTNLDIIGRFDENFMLQPVFFDEYQGNQPIEMMLSHVSFQNGNLIIQCLRIDLLTVPQECNNACYFDVCIVNLAQSVGVRSFLFFLVGSKKIRRR